jgi:hypothetical protein
MESPPVAGRALLSFRGFSIEVGQDHRPRVHGVGTPAQGAEDDEDNTGWQVWESSNVLLRYAAGRDETALGLAARSEGLVGGVPPPGSAADLRWLDLSAGAGLLSRALATIGAACAASETSSQLSQLRSNLHMEGSGCAHPPAVLQYYWGEDVAALRPPWTETRAEDGDMLWYDIALCSDLVYIALRDGRVPELVATLRALTSIATSVLLCFEERLMRDEDAFIDSLRGPCASGGPSVCVVEVLGSVTVLRKEDRIKGVGGDTADAETGDIFWEPPPVRIFILRAAT